MKASQPKSYPSVAFATTTNAATAGLTTGIRRAQKHYNVDDFFCFLGQTDNNEFSEAVEIRDRRCLDPHGLPKAFSRRACNDRDQISKSFSILTTLHSWRMTFRTHAACQLSRCEVLWGATLGYRSDRQTASSSHQARRE
jgi:hypothetical protein